MVKHNFIYLGMNIVPYTQSVHQRVWLKIIRQQTDWNLDATLWPLSPTLVCLWKTWRRKVIYKMQTDEVWCRICPKPQHLFIQTWLGLYLLQGVQRLLQVSSYHLSHNLVALVASHNPHLLQAPPRHSVAPGCPESTVKQADKNKSICLFSTSGLMARCIDYSRQR